MMDPVIITILDCLAAILFAAAMLFLTKSERYDDPGILPIMGLVIFSLIFLTAFTVFDFLGYSHLVTPIVADAWKEVTLPLAAMCLFIAAFLTKQLSDLIA